MKQRPSESTVPPVIDLAMETLFRRAAEDDIARADAVAGQARTQADIDEILREMRPFEDRLAASRKTLGDFGRSVAAAELSAERHRQGAYDLGASRGVPDTTLKDADEAAKLAATISSAPPPSAPQVDVSQWEHATCACNLLAVRSPADGDWYHQADGARCPTGPVSAANPLGGNVLGGQYPAAPEGPR